MKKYFLPPAEGQNVLKMERRRGWSESYIMKVQESEKVAELWKI